MYRTLSLGLALLVGQVAAVAAEQPNFGFLSAADQAALNRDGEVREFAENVGKLRLWKGSPFEASVSGLFSGRETTMAAEAWFVLPLKLPADPVAREKVLAKAMTSVSTMKGLQVYSISQKKMETFLFDAYRVGTTEKKSRLPDPDVSTAPKSLRFTMFQNEEQTGESFAELTYEHGVWYQVTQTNLTGLNYGIIPLVSPRGLLTAVFLVPYDDQIVVYGITAAKTLSLFGLERSKIASLYTRMEALVTWLTANLKGTAGTSP
jgi:hypothetical protein